MKISNGKITYGERTKLNSFDALLEERIAKLTCNSGFILEGPVETSCKVDENEGQWRVISSCRESNY